MTRTSREVIQVFCSFAMHCMACCMALLSRWMALPRAAALMQQSFHEFRCCCLPSLFRQRQPRHENKKTGLSAFLSGLVGWAWLALGGAKMTSWQPDRTDADFFRTSRRPSKSATCEKGPWSRLQSTSASIVDAQCLWIPFGDHPSKLERYRED